ncbi:hypothetical protein K8T06_09050 [bacterium]|nr:hypothetical protein [bacterium]
MNCQQARDVMDSQFENCEEKHLFELKIEEDLAKHLHVCPKCRIYHEDILMPLIDAAQLQPPELSCRLKSRIIQSMTSPPYSYLLFRYSAVFVFCCIIFAAGFFSRNVFDQKIPDQILPFYHSFDTECMSYSSQPMNPSAMFRSFPQNEPHLLCLTETLNLTLPSLLSAHGPYQLNSNQIQHTNAAACIPFVSPLGEVLTLKIEPTDKPGRSDTFMFYRDKTRVLFYSVSWIHDGWHCEISGRVPPDYLLDLAQELTVSRI